MNPAADARAAAFLQAVTWLRVALIPVIMGFILAGPDTPYAYVAGAAIFVVAAITDFFDGFLARRWAQTSAFGTFLDTTADKLLVTGALFALVAVDRASPWIAMIIVGRELLILGLKGAAAIAGRLVSPSFWGKAKANLQFLAIALAIVRMSEPIGPLYLDEYVMIVAAVLTVYSAVEYVVRFRSVVTTAP
jgi:CDP-diacylglycerol--glycerol-3-phosphate 3-phosphatidyltransferase